MQDNNVSELKDQSVFYLGAIGTIKNINKNEDTNVKEDEIILKFGISYI